MPLYMADGDKQYLAGLLGSRWAEAGCWPCQVSFRKPRDRRYLQLPYTAVVQYWVIRSRDHKQKSWNGHT